MKKQKETNEYDLDLKRFLNHRKTFPWAFLIKLALGIGLIIFIYYLSNQMMDNVKTKKQKDFEIEIINP